MEKILIEKEVKIPGTNVVLEKGDSLALLNENLIPVSMSRLELEFKKRPELEKLLKTPGNELPKNYQYLVNDPNIKVYSLYDLITTTQNLALSHENFFSELNGELIGWAGYFTDILNQKVFGFKMFAFDLNKQNDNFVLLRDLNRIFDKLLKEYNSIEFSAFDENPATKIYKNAIKHYESKGFGVNTTTKNGISTYTIFNK